MKLTQGEVIRIEKVAQHRGVDPTRPAGSGLARGRSVTRKMKTQKDVLKPTQVGPKYEINIGRVDSYRKICTTSGSRLDLPDGLRAGSGRVGDTKNENSKNGMMKPTRVEPEYRISTGRGDSNRKACTTSGSRPDSPSGLKVGSGRVGDTKNVNSKTGS